MYFPDNFAGVTAVSERVHRLVVRWWRTAIGRQLRRPALWESGECVDDGVPR